MVGFMRLLVCGGLFVAGYYLGRQSCRLESQMDQVDVPERPDAVADSDAPPPGPEDGRG